MDLIASCAFGLEAIVKRELKQLGYDGIVTSPGQIVFAGDWPAVCQTNLWLRCADRVSISLSQAACSDFDQLFDLAKQVDWRALLPMDSSIHVTGGSVKSQLSSVPAIQRTVKKAIVESMLAGSGSDRLSESGDVYRVHVAIRQDNLSLTLDTTGASLHKRGYREIATKAPLKETLAAALVQLSFWRSDRPFLDPFCGGGTIAIEAAMIARSIAPGLKRSFVCEVWPAMPDGLWDETRQAAKERILDPLEHRLVGTDIHEGALSLARRNARMAGVDTDVHFQARDFKDLTSKRQHGCLITNPPYGDRLDPVQLRELYESIPLVLRRLPTWSHFIITGYPNFERLIGKEANRRRKLYNGRIECTYFQFHGPSPKATKADVPKAEALQNEFDANGTDEHAVAKTVKRETARPTSVSSPVFGGVDTKTEEQAEIFISRLRKRAKHLRRWPTRRGITCYRVYERDIPEVPLVVDRYDDHLHIVEMERPHDRDIAQHADWLDAMVEAAGTALEVPIDRIFAKSRRRQKGSLQHERIDDRGYEIEVEESGLKFIVNLSDYTNTGLFLDHLSARQMVREMSQGMSVLNLFAYTGAFSVFAAAGGAKRITTVDWSSAYLSWAERNLQLNGFDEDAVELDFVREDAVTFMESSSQNQEYDLIVCDPPTFSNSKRSEDTWQVQRDHAPFIQNLVSRLSKNGTLFFSCNYKRFKLDEAELADCQIKEITKQTLPEDFRNRRVHRSWLIRS